MPGAEHRGKRKSRGIAKHLVSVLCAFALFAAPLAAQTLTSEQEHQREHDLLHISKLRPPRDATHPSRPDYANYDEDVATRTSTPLPNPLSAKDMPVDANEALP